ncbi:MAG: acetyl-CoA carboxylase, carboxyltransferase subunit beta [Armatimonadota bacterium]|nr:acetyl-CoA carboxylase, carboxyltransferase subunit beta [Armatimonadota bacterium]
MLNWLRRPKYAQVERREVPAGLWSKCPRCKALVYRKELERNLKVCPKCGYHLRLSARERIAVTFDPGSFVEHAADLDSRDILGFVGYQEKLEEAKKRTGNREACIIGEGTIEGFRVVTAVLDFPFLGGSMGTVVGEKIARAAELAMSKGLPLVTFSASGGARMQEGILSLMQLAKTSAAIGRLRDAGLAYISVLCDPTTGGVTASFAYLGDIVMAEPGALIGFAGPRVIEQTIRQKLPEGFQTAEFLLKHGMLDMVVPRTEMRSTLARLLRFFGAPRETRQEAAVP